jgi:hypothetical protein
MTADDHRGVESLEDRQEAVFSRQTGKDLVVVARSGMAEQHLAHAERFWPARQQPLVLRVKLLPRPAHDLSKRLRDS